MKNSVLCYLEETAARLPDKVAFFDAEGEITFEKLRKSAVDIAFAIQEKVGGRRNPILTYIPKSVKILLLSWGFCTVGIFTHRQKCVSLKKR